MDITLKNLSFGYGPVPVVSGISLALPQGSRTALMGRSGSGKTTLLHLLAGLLAPTGGSITGIEPGGCAMVFQQNRLLPWYTALQNLSIAVPEHTPTQHKALLARLGLEGWENAYPRELSGGMARRVAIARALARQKSPVLLLDEPFAGLDETTRAQGAAVVAQELAGRTLVAVVHDRQDAQLLDAAVLDWEALRSAT